MCGILVSGYAQEEVQDFQLWTGAKLKADLPKRFSLAVQYQLRLDQDATAIKGSYISTEIGYEIIKNYLAAEFEYRYVAGFDKDRHRFGFGIQGKYEYKKVTFSHRVVYQREHEYFNSSYERGHEPTNYLRNRFQVKFNLPKRWEAYVSIEPFIRFSNKLNDIDRVRTVGGFTWEFVKNHSFDLFYLFQADVNVSKPGMGHGIGFMYAWDLPKFKKKKKAGDKKGKLLTLPAGVFI